MKKILFIVILLLTLTTAIGEECKQWYDSDPICDYTDFESQPCYDGCAFDWDAFDTNSCIVGKEQTPQGVPPCVTESNICVEGSCPETTDLWNGADCSVSVDKGSDTGSNCVRTGKWDASEDACVECTANHREMIPFIGWKNFFYCNNIREGICESSCGSDIECDEVDVGGQCNGKTGVGICQADCTCSTGGTLPSEAIPTLPDTEFCKDVNYCVDVTVVNEGTKDADVFGCIYCQDITIDNKDCTKVAGTFSDYAPSEIPVCPEKIESVDVECLGLPEDISKNISTEYEKLLKQYGGGSAAYILPLIPKISAASIYNQIIQDVSAAAAPQCEISSVKWSTEEAWDGEEVTVTLNTNNCIDGTDVKFEIYEDDGCDFNIIPMGIPFMCKNNGVPFGPGTPVPYLLGGDPLDTKVPGIVGYGTYKTTGNTASYKWKVRWESDIVGYPEFYAVAYVNPSSGEIYQNTDGLLTVHTCVKTLKWSQTEAFDKDKVKMEVVTTKECENKDIKLTICEDDGLNGPDPPLYEYCTYPDSEIPLGGGPISTKLDGTSKSVEWTATWTDDTNILGSLVNKNPPEFYFGIEFVPSMGSAYKESSNILTVSRCIKTAKWDRNKASVGEEVTLTVETTKDCAEKKIEIEILDDDGVLDPDDHVATVTKSGDKVDENGKFTVKWKAQLAGGDYGGSEEDYFTVKILDGATVYDEKDSDIMNVYLCLKSAEWSEKNAVQGDEVTMNAEVGGQCTSSGTSSGYNIRFFICEDDYFDIGEISPWDLYCDNIYLSGDDPVPDPLQYRGQQPLTKEKFHVPWSVIYTDDSPGDAVDEYYFVTQITDSADNVVDEMKSDLLFAHYCIKSAEWSAENVFKDDEVTMTIETSNLCNGKDVELQIYQDNIPFVGGMFLQPSPCVIFGALPSTCDNFMDIKTSKVSCVDNKCKAEAKWKAEWISDWPDNPPEYYFKAIIRNAGKVDGRDIDDFIDSDQLIVNECWDNALILCQHTKSVKATDLLYIPLFIYKVLKGETPEYIVIDASRYFQLAKKEFPEIDQTKYWILDMEYTIANGKTCMKDNISKYTIIDNEKYRDYIHNTYGNEEFYKKFKEMYGQDYADDLYCYKTVLKDTQWCQDMSREWYGLENNSVDVVDEKYLNEINKWNFYQGIDEMPDKDIFKDKEYGSSVIFEDVWTKVFTVSSLLNDTRNYLEWVKTGDGNAYAGWGFDRKSICGSSCDAGTGTNAASGCTEKSNECDTCEGGECGDCKKVSGCSTNPDPKDCYKTCKVDERSGYIVDADVVNAGVVYGIPTDCGGDGFTNYQCTWGYSCVDFTLHKCAKCDEGYDLLSLTMYDRHTYSETPTYSKVYKCIMDGVIKGETKFTIKDATVPDGVQPVKTRIKDNIWSITHPAFSITETGNLPYNLESANLTKNGDVYTLTEFYKPDSSYNKLRFEIDADTNFFYTILPNAGKLQIEVNHTYTTSYIKDTYYAACSYGACNCGCSGDGCGNPGGQYYFSSAGCGETSSWYSCGGCCYNCGEGSRGCGNYVDRYQDERTTEILTDTVNVSEHWGFPWIWNFTTGGPVGTSPAVAYGKVFVSSNNKLYALDEFSGKKIWEFSISSSESSPTAADDMVFVGSGNGILYAIDERTGTQQWSWTVPGNIQINTKPAVDKGRVFFGSDDGRVYALDEFPSVNTGKQFWNYTTSAPIKSSPTVADGMVFVGSDDGKIYALDEFSGEKKWEFTTMPTEDSYGHVWKKVRSSPTVSDGVVFVGSDGFFVYALDEFNGNYIWFSQAFAPVRTKPAVHDYRVFVGTMGLCSPPEWCSNIIAMDRYNGNPLWGYMTGNDILSSPAVAYNRVFFGSNDYNFSALDEDNGNLVWSYDAGGPIQSSPVIDKGMVFFGSVNGQVYALSAGIFPAHENPAEDARIKIEGNIDRYSTGTGFYGETVIGEINITLDPDILGSFVLSAECAFLMYTSQIYPAEHKLIAKESSAGTLGKNYNYNESYGYENSEFGYLEQCRKTCPLECNCYVTTTTIPAEDWNRLSPNCTEFSEEGEEISRIRTDCVCLPDWCYPEQCKSTRTFHEDEGSTIANGDFETIDLYGNLASWKVISGTPKQEPGGVSGYKLKLNGEISQNIPSLSTNPANQICLDYWINSGNTGSFKLTAVVDGTSAVVDGTSKEFTVYKSTPTSTPTCSTVGWHKFCTPITGKISSIDLKSDIEVFVDNVNLGKYYDFVDLKTFSLEDVEIMDEKLSPKNSFGGISFDDITHENNTYSLIFSTTQLPYTVFEDANITLITHFRNITVKLFPASADVRENPYVNVKLNDPSLVELYRFEPGRFSLKPGTRITIYGRVINGETKNPIPNANIIVLDLDTTEELTRLIADSNGEFVFVSTIGDSASRLRFIYLGGN